LNVIHKSYLIVKGVAVLLDMLLNILSLMVPSIAKRTRTICAKTQAIATVGSTVHPHLPYSINIVLSGFHLFGHLKRYSKDTISWITTG